MDAKYLISNKIYLKPYKKPPAKMPFPTFSPAVIIILNYPITLQLILLMNNLLRTLLSTLATANARRLVDVCDIVLYSDSTILALLCT